MSMNGTFRVINDLVRNGVIGRYAVAGAVAALNYIEPMSTADLDILISVAEMKHPQSGLVTLAPIFEHLRKAGYVEFKDEGLLIDGWPVQFLPVADDLDAEALALAVEVEVTDAANSAPINITVLRAEHLVAIALRVGRLKDSARIVDFLDQDAVDLQVLAGVLDRHHLRDKWTKFCAQANIGDPKIINLEA
jgi:hypothetical protein